MIDRFLTRIANARGFLAKLWVLARPYWFAQELSTVRVVGVDSRSTPSRSFPTHRTACGRWTFFKFRLPTCRRIRRLAARWPWESTARLSWASATTTSMGSMIH